jgi:hypothetical protein
VVGTLGKGAEWALEKSGRASVAGAHRISKMGPNYGGLADLLSSQDAQAQLRNHRLLSLTKVPSITNLGIRVG